MGGLCFQKKAVDHRDGDGVHQVQIDAHSQFREKVHRLFATDLLSPSKRLVGVFNLLLKLLASGLKQKMTRFPLIIDQDRDDLLNLFNQFLFRFSQRELIADLIKIAHGLGTFAEQPPNREVDLLKRAEDPVDLSGLHKRREMKHDADPKASSDIGRASSEVAPTIMKGEIKIRLQSIIKRVGCIPRFFHVATRFHDLQPKVILFVDHHTEPLTRIDDHRTRAFAIRQFTTNQLSLDQKLTIELIKVFDRDVERVFKFVEGSNV